MSEPLISDARQPLRVLMTVDTEIWPDWSDLHKWGAKLALDRDYYGRTPSGDYGVPYQLKTLAMYGLKACYFVEPLITGVFGIDLLKAMVSPIREAGQEIELHTHAEWAPYSTRPIVSNASTDRVPPGTIHWTIRSDSSEQVSRISDDAVLKTSSPFARAISGLTLLP